MAASRGSRLVPGVDRAGGVGALGLALGAGLAAGAFAVAVTAGPPSLRLPLVAAGVLALLLALASDARRLLMAVVIVDVPLQAGEFFGYRDGPASLGAIGGIEVSATTIAIVLLWAMRLIDPDPLAPARWHVARRVAAPLGLYVAAVALSAATAGEPALSLAEVAMLVQTLAVLLYLSTSLRDRSEVLFAVSMLLVGLLLEGALALWVLAGGPVVNALGIDIRVEDDGGFTRFGGTLGSPNVAAGFFGMSLVVALAVLLAPVERRQRLLAAAALTLGGLGLVTTLGRGGWLAFAVSLVLFASLARWRGILPPGLRLRPAAAAILLLFVILFGSLVGSRLVNDDANAAGSRVPLLHIAEDMVRDHPLTGVGANNYAVASEDYRTRDIAGEWQYTVHNKYLLVWSEAGLLALVAFVWFLVATFRLGLEASRTGDRTMRLLALGLAAGVAGNAVHMVVEILNDRAAVQSLWVMAALIAAIGGIASTAGTAAEAEPESAR